MNVNKCSKGLLEVLSFIQNDVRIGQVYIILDDLSHKWKKRHRPKENLPPGGQDPVIWRVAGTRPVSQAGPGVSNTGGRTDGPVPVPACRRARARTQSSGVFPGGCALAGSLARSREENLPFLQSRKQETNLWKAYCAPAMKFRLLGRWFLCSCLWNCYFPVALESIEACFSSWFVDRLTHCVRVSFRIGIWKPPTWSSSLEPRDLQGERSGTSLVAKKKLVKEKRFAYRNYLLLVTQSCVCAISLSLSLSLSLSIVPSGAARKSRATAATPHLAARAGFRVFWSRGLFVGLGELERKERPCWVVKARARFLASWVLKFLDFEALVGTRKWAQE